VIKQVEIAVFPDKINDEAFIKDKAISKVKNAKGKVESVRIVRRSIDARGRRPLYRLRCDVYYDEVPKEETPIIKSFKDVSEKEEVIIVGAGPAGYFAALQCIEEGLKPIVLDRGKDVRRRRRDLRAIQQEGEVHPHSNYCFGEGGAGTYSDGKLYTRSLKRGNYIKALQLLVEHGAQKEILIDAHPHIGSNKLPKIVSAIRETIERFGGEVRFDTQVVDFILQEGSMEGVVLADGSELKARAVILATGHSARDIYALIEKHGIYAEAKPFALGLRIEHPQSIIDKIQYNQEEREENLPAASYKLVTQVKDRGVFSFCMCPGGLVVPAATAPGEIVVNGMSLSRRDSPYSNSGFVTAVELEDLEKAGYTGLFASMDFQKYVEQKMFSYGDGSQKAPAQRVKDFVEGKISKELNPTSYIPGLISAPLHELLPDFIYQRLRQGLLDFGKKMKGYYTNQANVIGVESRTSSPIRIPRNRETYQHDDVEGLFPCGEGAGYAGGILSACMDGQNVAKAVKRMYDEVG
jgi:uncharacterized FAD-dependent dehydrogenase